MDNNTDRKIVALGDVTMDGFHGMTIEQLYKFFLKQAQVNSEEKDEKLLSDISITLVFDMKNKDIKVITKADVSSIVPGDKNFNIQVNNSERG